MVLCVVLGNGSHPEVLREVQYMCGLHPRLTYLDLTKCLSLRVCTPVFHRSHSIVSRCLCFVSGLSTWKKAGRLRGLLPCLQE